MNLQLRDDHIEVDASMMMTGGARDLEERLRALDLQTMGEVLPASAKLTEATHSPCHEEEEISRHQRPKSRSGTSIRISEHHDYFHAKKDTHQKCGTVHFADPLHTIVAHIPAIDDIPTLERLDIWWRAQDFHSFRMVAKTVSYDLQLLDKGVVERHLERGGYTKANLLALTVVDELALEVFLTTGIQHQSMTAHVQRLVEWTHRTKGRGLEHWTSRKHHLFRREAMHESRNIVLSLTRDQEVPQEVVKQYQEHSRASRILARLMAEADAITAQHVHAEEVVVDVTAVKPATDATVGVSLPPAAAATAAAVVASATTQRQSSSFILSSSSTRRPSIASRNRQTYLDLKLPVQHRGIA